MYFYYLCNLCKELINIPFFILCAIRTFFPLITFTRGLSIFLVFSKNKPLAFLMLTHNSVLYFISFCSLLFLLFYFFGVQFAAFSQLSEIDFQFVNFQAFSLLYTYILSYKFPTSLCFDCISLFNRYFYYYLVCNLKKF